jgi:hypothetical protein
MKRLLLSLATLVAFGALAVGLASASASDHPAGRGGTVATAGSKLGRILDDSRGRTLYLAADKPARAPAMGCVPASGRH